MITENRQKAKSIMKISQEGVLFRNNDIIFFRLELEFKDNKKNKTNIILFCR